RVGISGLPKACPSGVLGAPPYLFRESPVRPFFRHKSPLPPLPPEQALSLAPRLGPTTENGRKGDILAGKLDCNAYTDLARHLNAGRKRAPRPSVTRDTTTAATQFSLRKQ